MLFLPSKKSVKWNATSKQLAAQSYNVKVPMSLPKWTCYQSSHWTSSHKRGLLSIVYSTVCLLLALLNCESRKHGLKCASAKHLLEEGMERVSPVRLAFLQTLTAWLCCCKGPNTRTTTNPFPCSRVVSWVWLLGICCCLPHTFMSWNDVHYLELSSCPILMFNGFWCGGGQGGHFFLFHDTGSAEEALNN